MLTKSLPKYDQLPILTPDEITKIQGDILYYDQLILNTSQFTHPGTKSILEPYHNKDISQVFHYKSPSTSTSPTTSPLPPFSHSFNAKLLLLNLSIGRNSANKGKGYDLLNQISQQKKYTVHEKIMKDLDFSKGLLKQLEKFNVEELEAFVSIPKYFGKNGEGIKFKDGWVEEMMYLDRFWVSTVVFILVLVGVAGYLVQNDEFFDTGFKFVLFALGIIIWTLIQYYFHRILLHTPLTPSQPLNGHYIHHAFPNLPTKLALSITKNLLYQLLIYLTLTSILHLPSSPILHLMMGIHTMMILYDMLHYYFHFGGDGYVLGITELRRNHLKHHFKDMGRGFGVTNLGWDWVFGTGYLE